jgi:ankyrin repeat protein
MSSLPFLCKLGYTPLLLAGMGGHKEVVQLLLEGGADVESRNMVRFFFF